MIAGVAMLALALGALVMVLLVGLGGTEEDDENDDGSGPSDGALENPVMLPGRGSASTTGS